MLSRTKYKRIADLYVTGTALALKDGTVIWLQVLNPYEQDDARHEAATARARLVLAIKEHGSDETIKIEGAFREGGLDSAIEQLVDVKGGDLMYKMIGQVRADPDWKERLAVLDGADEISAPAEDIEVKLVEKIEADFRTEVTRRYDVEIEYLRSKYRLTSEDDLWKEYLDSYIERRGTDVFVQEFNLAQLQRAVRVCEGVHDADGLWDHSGCEGHQVRVFETKVQIRDLPGALQDLLIQTLRDLNMPENEAKNLVRHRDSFGSSRSPSEVEESTPSTPIETQDEPPGISPQPSDTPSLSLAGSS